MNEAHILRASHKFSKSEALRKGWILAKTHHAMRTHEVTIFEFLKTDGTLRRAFGTLHPNVIPPTRGLRTPPPTTQVFYDVEKNEWRSFRKANILRIIG